MNRDGLVQDQMERISIDLIRDLMQEGVLQTGSSFYAKTFLSGTLTTIEELNSID